MNTHVDICFFTKLSATVLLCYITSQSEVELNLDIFHTVVCQDTHLLKFYIITFMVKVACFMLTFTVNVKVVYFLRDNRHKLSCAFGANESRTNT